jgi:DNA-directed RNA polymerase omega subunit
MQPVWKDRRHTNPPPIDRSALNGQGEAASANERFKPPRAPGSVFPHDAVARIYRPARSPMTSGKARTKEWMLRFDPRTPPFIEPLMGWTASDDTLTQVELTFPTREAAIAYAERQGFAYVVEDGNHTMDVPHLHRASGKPREERAQALYEDALSACLWFAWLKACYGRCDQPRPPDLERALIDPAAVFRAPVDVVDHPDLSYVCKREILSRWAWDEYLLELASDEAMPEGNARSRLHEVKCALLALEEARRDGLLVLSVPAARSAGRHSGDHHGTHHDHRLRTRRAEPFRACAAAAARARALYRGEKPRVSPQDDKPTVIALREIAAGALDPIRLRQRLLEPWRDDVGDGGVPDGSLGVA